MDDTDPIDPGVFHINAKAVGKGEPVRVGNIAALRPDCGDSAPEAVFILLHTLRDELNDLIRFADELSPDLFVHLVL